MSNLVLFTNRSGSTILSDILAYNDKSVNVGEGLHSIARHYNYNTKENRYTELYKEFATTSLTGLYHNNKTRGSDYIGFFKAKEMRTKLLKNSSLQWTAKENLEKLSYDINFIEYCLNNNVNVYMTHRADVVAQFTSKINARYRLEIGKFGTNNESQFIYTNQDRYEKYSEMRIPFTWLHLYTNVFLEQLMVWRIVYERFKNSLQIVSYENSIRPMNFKSIGINDEVVINYQNETKHLIPTPNNSKKVIVADDHPAPIVGAWEQALYYIEKHKYLVEI